MSIINIFFSPSFLSIIASLVDLVSSCPNVYVYSLCYKCTVLLGPDRVRVTGKTGGCVPPPIFTVAWGQKIIPSPILGIKSHVRLGLLLFLSVVGFNRSLLYNMLSFLLNNFRASSLGSFHPMTIILV